MFAYAIRAIGSWPGWWRAQHLAVRDGLLAVAVTLLAYVPTMSAMSAQIGDLPRRPPDALAVLLALAQSVPLVIRSRRPAACVAVVGSAFAAHQALAYPPTFASIGLYLSLYAAGAHQARFRYGLAAAASCPPPRAPGEDSASTPASPPGTSRDRPSDPRAHLRRPGSGTRRV
ncbi:hypothetical protein [Acrocarpospora sp. B8E8]|uniref:DUF7134 domain-containing protein n=1 Tax=Acrocarpospora sp. B8E8 TaxID=3153572 RepID=UPI00325E3920